MSINSRVAREFGGIWKSRIPSAARACRVPLGSRSAARHSADGIGSRQKKRGEKGGVFLFNLIHPRRKVVGVSVQMRRTPCGEGSADRLIG